MHFPVDSVGQSRSPCCEAIKWSLKVWIDCANASFCAVGRRPYRRGGNETQRRPTKTPGAKQVENISVTAF